MTFLGVPVTETADFPPPEGPHCWVYLTLNAEIALSAPTNPRLHQLVQQQRARVSVDGQWIWWGLRRKYARRAVSKLSGSDLIYRLSAWCRASGDTVLLLGSSLQNNTAAVQALRRRYPGLKVVGHAPEHFDVDSAQEQAVLERALQAIRLSRAHYVVLGLGPEKEQRLALQLAPRLDGQVHGLLCFGGAIDMASGRVRRAPLWVQCIGLEGLYRVWQQPARFNRLLRVLRILPVLASGRY